MLPPTFPRGAVSFKQTDKSRFSASTWRLHAVPVTDPDHQAKAKRYGFLPTSSSTLYNGKTLATRLIEISSSVGGAFLMNKYLLQNDLYRNEVFKKVGVIALSDV